MIRSPISAEERLKNRVEALEGRVKKLLDIARSLHAIVSDHEKSITELDSDMSTVFNATGI